MEGKKGDEWVLPVKKQYFEISSGFGKRESDFTVEKKEFHPGIDITKEGIENTLVFAFADGIVKEAGTDKHGGIYVIIHHSDYQGYFGGYYSRFHTLYVHFNEIYVDEGDYVKAGTPIGTVGNTGRSTGPHLHFETLINGEPVNPENFLDRRRNLDND